MERLSFQGAGGQLWGGTERGQFLSDLNYFVQKNQINYFHFFDHFFE